MVQIIRPLFIFSILSLPFSCAEKKTTHKKVYTFLEVCYEDFYLNYDVDVTQELNLFERHLISEKHLADTSGQSYKRLLKKLSENTYFSPPLKFDNFNNAVLYKVPDNLLECTQSIFGVDSSLVKTTPYFKAQKRIRKELKSKKEISINQLFKYNSEYLSAKSITSPFVKQSILQLLYKWYFKSKYDREIPLSEEHIKNSDSTQIAPVR